MAGIVEGKKLLITGITMESSIAFHVARIAQEQGAEVVITSFGRVMRITQIISKRLPIAPQLVELDVTKTEDLDSFAERLRSAGVESIDGVLHSIAFAPPGAFNFMEGTWEDATTALHASAYSLKALATASLPLITQQSALVGLTFDAKFAWPIYDWMGVAKAALESINRYLARDLGAKKIRSNLVSAGPIRTTAAKAIPGFEAFEQIWSDRAPLGWDITDPEPAARACVVLLSDWFPATTGEIVHVDGGVHMMG